MKRSPIVLLSTVAGVAAVLALNPDGSGTLSAGSLVSSSGTVDTPAGASPSPSTSATTKATTTAKAKSATGDAYSAREYGEVQVKVTVRNGKITKISTVAMPANDGKSQWISEQAGPLLVEQALSSQSASINGVSGATFTSMAFAQSLQSALDKLGM